MDSHSVIEVLLGLVAFFGGMFVRYPGDTRLPRSRRTRRRGRNDGSCTTTTFVLDAAGTSGGVAGYAGCMISTNSAAILWLSGAQI